MSNPRGRNCFKRMETDAEFVVRINVAGGQPSGSFAQGEVLDEYAWVNFKMQRKIVEDVA